MQHQVSRYVTSHIYLGLKNFFDTWRSMVSIKYAVIIKYTVQDCFLQGQEFVKVSQKVTHAGSS